MSKSQGCEVYLCCRCRCCWVGFFGLGEGVGVVGKGVDGVDGVVVVVVVLDVDVLVLDDLGVVLDVVVVVVVVVGQVVGVHMEGVVLVDLRAFVG